MSIQGKFTFILFCIFFHCSFALKYPVILVPGDGGSQVEAKLNKPSVVHYICDKTTADWFSLWLNMELLMPVVIDCFIDNMKLVYDNTSRTTQNSPGVETRIPGFGNCSTVQWIDPSKTEVGCYYKDIGNMLSNMGYHDGVSLRGAPYDFRKGPNEQGDFFLALKGLIENTYEVNNKTQVVMLVHSLGGLMTLTLLHQMTQSWKDKYIKAMISLSGAWGGSVKAVKVYATGDDLGTFVLSRSTLRAEQITSPSLAWLMPSPQIWKMDDNLVETPEKNYTLANIKDFFNDLNYETGWEMYKDVNPYFNLDPPGVEMYCLYGHGLPTVEKLLYAEGKFPAKPVLVTGDGDGTVNRASLESCKKWKEHQNQPVHEIPLPGLDHMTILRSPQTLQYLQDILSKMNV